METVGYLIASILGFVIGLLGMSYVLTGNIFGFLQDTRKTVGQVKVISDEDGTYLFLELWEKMETFARRTKALVDVKVVDRDDE